MSTGITNDRQFRAALDAMSTPAQRELAARFVESVQSLSTDVRVAQALAAARESRIAEDALALARRNTKAASLEAHTRCGADGEWTDQAAYFVARAAEAALEPAERTGKGIAWKAAMNARMARTCLAADGGDDPHDSESAAQYAILTRYLDTRGQSHE
jgi:hypothetical protein